jgi:NADH:ubiquinone oxidoreductase subunit 5 (subunit L)/multisubunit Na+/H+ antiporter MnhA subunit
MEAPVPASALIHSATLVSSGIFLILKFKILLLKTFFIKNFFLFNSVLTILNGAFVSVFQTDLKKILAYSTINNCGFLVFFSLLFDEHIVILFLYNHGLFKALGFFCIGNIINYSLHNQSFKKMGGLKNYFNFEFYCLLIVLFNLSNFFFSFGFFIKHYSFSLNFFKNIFFILVLFFGSLSSYFYSFLIIKNIFFKNKKTNRYYFLKKKLKKNNFNIFFFFVSNPIYTHFLQYFIFFKK